MGKRIIQQRRGKGSSTYRAHSFRFKGKLSYNTYNKDQKVTAEIIDLLHSKGHSAPLMKVRYEDKKEALLPAFEGACVGQKIEVNQKDKLDSKACVGSSYLIKNLAEGTNIYNIELKPGDSGRLVKSGGSFAKIVTQMKSFTKIKLPSKKEKLINNNCRCFVGIVAGGGRLEKPFLKAGAKALEKSKKNKLYPNISGVAMSAYDHPFGSSRSLRKGRPTIAPKNAPAGRKVGMVKPKNTGKKK